MQLQTMQLNCLHMRRTANQGHVVASACQHGTIKTADGAAAYDHDGFEGLSHDWP
jgi:hypothetical protein